MRARAARGQPGTVLNILLCKQINPLMRSMKAAVLLPSLCSLIQPLLAACPLFRSSALRAISAGNNNLSGFFRVSTRVPFGWVTA